MIKQVIRATATMLLILASSLSSPVADSAQPSVKQTLEPSIIERSLSAAREVNAEASAKSSASPKVGRFLRPVIARNKASQTQSGSPLYKIDTQDRVQVYVSLKNVDSQAQRDLNAAGLTIELINQDLGKAQGWIAIDAIDALAQLANVLKITVPSYGDPARGRVTTQGDTILGANLVRELGITGAGVKVGIVSDGANSWRSAAATGDLPSQVTTYGSCATRADDPRNCRSRLTCNEGTAMAEIIHDLAPDAELAVAAVSTSLEFIQQINRLAGTFQADIIVDDLGFFGEPYFEDGDIARAVSALPSRVLYFSSAGNSGNTHYERQYSTLTSSRHNFGSQAGSNDDAIGFTIRPNRGVFVLLQWSDRYNSPNSDYDLFVFDSTQEIGRSSGRGSTAIEGVCVYNGTGGDAVRFAVVDKAAGSNRRLEMFFLGASNIEYPTQNGSVFGHAGTRRAIAVGAINAGSSGPAFYSSRGPARVEYPSLENRSKPDIAATDGVSVTGAGGFPSTFFGTSAAAPHAAGVAALLLSAGPDVSPAEVRSAMLSSATGGSSSALGRGRVSALAAFNKLGITPPGGGDGTDPDPEEPEPEPEPEPELPIVTPSIYILLDDDER